jgi:peptidoglycan/xylan/chitin deacetylase (PgdA/CDA1 family)
MANLRMSLAHLTCLVSFLAAILLAFVDVRLSLIPLSIFIALCSIAPFIPSFSFFLPIISSGNSGKPAVAITFDDGPHSESTPALLELLLKHKIYATFFVTGKEASEHPELIKEILSQGHTVGNHSYSHDNLIMFKGSKTLIKEITSAQDILRKFGITPLAFRPPVGITNPRLGKVLDKSGMYNVNFNCRAIDGGNRWIKNLSERILRRIHPDAIVALHDVKPRDDTLFTYWLNEIDLIFSGIREKGLAVIPLSELIGRPVMLYDK